jgi:hypothetical protein
MSAGVQAQRLQTARGPVYVLAQPGAQSTVVYVHGYRTTVDQAMAQFQLATQFAATGMPATFLVPEAPIGAADGVKFPSLQELLEAVGQVAPTPDPVIVIGHSGAYRTILKWLGDPRMTTIILLDALYAGVAQFAAWARIPGHRLINITTRAGAPHDNASVLAREPNVTTQVQPLSHFALVTPPTSVIPEVLRRVSGPGLAAVGVLLAIAALAAWAIS